MGRGADNNGGKEGELARSRKSVKDIEIRENILTTNRNKGGLLSLILTFNTAFSSQQVAKLKNIVNTKINTNKIS